MTRELFGAHAVYSEDPGCVCAAVSGQTQHHHYQAACDAARSASS